MGRSEISVGGQEYNLDLLAVPLPSVFMPSINSSKLLSKNRSHISPIEYQLLSPFLQSVPTPVSYISSYFLF